MNADYASDSSTPPEAYIRRPGRPKGSKNKKTLINEARAAKLESASSAKLIRALEMKLVRKGVEIDEKTAEIREIQRKLRSKERELKEARARANNAETLATERLDRIRQLEARNPAPEAENEEIELDFAGKV